MSLERDEIDFQKTEPTKIVCGDHWLSMLVTDGSYVDLAVVGGLWVRYKL